MELVKCVLLLLDVVISSLAPDILELSLLMYLKLISFLLSLQVSASGSCTFSCFYVSKMTQRHDITCDSRFLKVNSNSCYRLFA